MREGCHICGQKQTEVRLYIWTDWLVCEECWDGFSRLYGWNAKVWEEKHKRGELISEASSRLDRENI